NALYDSQVQLLKLLNGEVVLINSLKYNMFVPEQIARRRLYQALSFEGVEAVYPLYTNEANWKNPDTREIRPLRVLAFNLNDPVLNLPEIQPQLPLLQPTNTALMDTRSRAEVGTPQAGIETELSERNIRIVGTFTLGTDFASGNGNLVMSDRNFIRYFNADSPDAEARTLSTVDIGLLKLSDKADPAAVVAALRQNLPNDVSVLTRDEFVNQELTYWRENTNIGFVFSLLTAMGFIVGIILVYQILYTDVADHWAEYATLKAMGYSNFYLLGVVMQEAALLTALGFLPGWAISVVLYQSTADATGLLMRMTSDRALGMLAATFVMCLISGAIAVRKVQAADPAEVFG
ncbi:MAG: ABC transporter permease DevC, partial [Cyanobacteria bacterium J06639_1]